MPSILRISSLFAGVLAVSPAVPVRAQISPAPFAAPVTEPAKPAAATESTSSPASPKPAHVMSRDFAATLAGVMPKYNPPAKPTEEPADLRETDKPRNGIIRLPKYEVKVTKEPKPMVFTERELLTGKGMAGIAMKRNPGLHFGNIFGWNQGIAILMYQEQVRLDNIAAMEELATNARNSGDAAGADALTRETNRAYYRQSDIGGGNAGVGR